MTLYGVNGLHPQLKGENHFIAPNATIVGDVTLHEQVSIWFGVIIRAENDAVSIGARSNIQDGAVLHVDPGCPISIAEDVTVGHRAVLHGCAVGAGSLIGMNAVILNNAVIGKSCLIGANALVTEGMVIPDGSLVLGSPAVIKKTLSVEQQLGLQKGASNYIRNAQLYNDTLQIYDEVNHEQ